MMFYSVSAFQVYCSLFLYTRCIVDVNLLNRASFLIICLNWNEMKEEEMKRSKWEREREYLPLSHLVSRLSLSLTVSSHLHTVTVSLPLSHTHTHTLCLWPSHYSRRLARVLPWHSSSCSPSFSFLFLPLLLFFLWHYVRMILITFTGEYLA